MDERWRNASSPSPIERFPILGCTVFCLNTEKYGIQHHAFISITRLTRLLGVYERSTNMNRFVKVLVTAVIVILTLFLISVITAARREAGYHRPGIWGTVVGVGAFFAIRAIWKKGKQSADKDGDDTSVLQ